MSSNPQVESLTKTEHTPGPATEWRTTKRTYPAVRGTNQLAVTPEEFDEALQTYAAFRNRDMLAALKAIVEAWNGPLEKRSLKPEHLETAKNAIAKAGGQ